MDWCNTEERKAMRREEIAKAEKMIAAYTNGAREDDLTDEIYFCCFHSHTNPEWKSEFDVLKSKIDAICQAQNGKLYQTIAKGSKYIIVCDLSKCTDDYFDMLRQKYDKKVISLECAAEYFGLLRLWPKDKRSSERKELIAYYKDIAELPKGDSFHIDFVKVNSLEMQTNLQDCDVLFPYDDIDAIYIDGRRLRGWCGKVSESGMSKDGLYHRVHLADYTFWVKPDDYEEFYATLQGRRAELSGEDPQAYMPAAAPQSSAKKSESAGCGTLSLAITIVAAIWLWNSHRWVVYVLIALIVLLVIGAIANKNK